MNAWQYNDNPEAPGLLRAELDRPSGSGRRTSPARSRPGCGGSSRYPATLSSLGPPINGPLSESTHLERETVVSKKLEGKVAIITGGISGMGQAIAKRF